VTYVSAVERACVGAMAQTIYVFACVAILHDDDSRNPVVEPMALALAGTNVWWSCVRQRGFAGPEARVRSASLSA
jgi:hypothetical protein